MTVRTRFAPSPTGYLHIGGVRTALFNWLFARQHGGQFLLRIDDTDAERNVAEALQPILDGFKWLGLDWDEGPTDDGRGSRGPCGSYFQSQRLQQYQAAVKSLLDKGFAYRDFGTTEELKSEREAAEKEKVILRVFPEDEGGGVDTVSDGRDNVQPTEKPGLLTGDGDEDCLRIARPERDLGGARRVMERLNDRPGRQAREGQRHLQSGRGPF